MLRNDPSSQHLKAKAEEAATTRPDLILQPDQPLRSGLIVVPSGSSK
jgi:hypothetical protein